MIDYKSYRYSVRTLLFRFLLIGIIDIFIHVHPEGPEGPEDPQDPQEKKGKKARSMKERNTD